MAILEIHEVSKTFGGLVAVNDVSFSVNKGEIFGIIGPNGAGKTTLFNTIGGFYGPDRGSIKFNGKEISNLKPHEVCKRGIVRTFQICKPFPSLTVEENILVGACHRNPTLKRAKRDAEKIIELVGLKEKKGICGSDLSTPDKKLLEVARALASRPQLMLLDESAAGLNSTEVIKFMDFIKGIAEEKQLTILLVEHVLQVVMNLCERIMVLDYGKKLAEGSPTELAKNPEVISAYLGKEYGKNA